MDKLTVKNIRNLLGLNQTQMADKLGMSRHTYANKETGRSSWFTTEAEAFLEVTGYKFEQVKF